MMAVPLQDEGKIIGILYADTANLAHKFSEDLLKIMATFGNLLAAKVNNYKLLLDRRAKEAIEAELAVAAEIQKMLLPQTLPKIDR